MTASYPELRRIVEQLAEYLSADDANPGGHSEKRELERGETVTSRFHRGLEAEGQSRGLHHGKAQGPGDEGTYEDGDGRA